MQTQTSSALHNAIMEAGDANATPVIPGNNGIDNDIYSIVDACPNAMKMWKAIERLKQEPKVVTDDDTSLKEKELDKLMALISMCFKKIYKPTNNNLRTSSNIRNLNVENTPRSRVNLTTSVSRPHHKSNRLEDRVLHNNSQGKKKEVEDHHRNFKFSDNKTFVTACNDSLNVKTLNEIILFIVEYRCSKHMTRNFKLLVNFVEKFMGMVKFGNDQFAFIFGYGDLVQGNITIKRVYYVKGLNHNLFSVGQFCDADLEVSFRKYTCYVRDLKGNDLLTGSHGTNLYSITLQDTTSPNSICLMAKSTSSRACYGIVVFPI
uniref:Integrase, catalytic region, zinc finger, CCHC-type, peptidase aspartic, catalytic n=1 Tax=Tanacetum cinerariifolium TaxID=118510 RepID=A0A6L2M2I4_TANCI|nr:integrase, catalytic region, zinc finger, CCHC-type, peptidase aspartic, catalytic [Tanacetum cinerariifolium]